MRLKYSIPTLALLFSFTHATTVKDVVNYTIENNQDIASKTLNNEAFRKYVDEQKSGYYPKLDLTAYLEKKKEDLDYDAGAGIDATTDYKGGNAQLDLEQLLYDGNLTPNLVEEAKSNYLSNKYKNAADIENILYDSISAYLNIIKFDERIAASKDNLAVHEDYLSIATQTEEINGEILDKVQTKAKIYSAKSNLFGDMNNRNSAISSFNKNVGMKLDESFCRPDIDKSLIPSSLDELYKIALKNNYTIKEQIKAIDSQRALISQSKSNFLPTLKLKLQALYDRDLLEEDLETTQYSGKIELRYNIFNGMLDSAKTDREELFLREAQAKLDVATKTVLDELTVSYNTYQTAIKQSNELKKFIEENKTIIDIYKDQFDAGTRNFIDVLNVEADLYNSNITLINTEFDMYLAYYNILKNTSILQKSIKNSSQNSCSDTTSNISATTEDTSVQELLEENTMMAEEAVTQTESLTNDNYAIFLISSSYSKYLTTKQADLNLKDDVKSKIVTNPNGTHTLVLYNIPTEQKAMDLKEEFSSSYPGAYYKKK